MKSRKIGSWVLATMLSLVMAVTLLPSAAFATGGTSASLLSFKGDGVGVESVDISRGGHAEGTHCAVIKKDGSLWMWGSNFRGQLGNGTVIETDQNTPNKVMDNVASVSLGATYTIALKTDGTVWAWGANECGQLGDGTNIDRLTPVKVMEDVVSIDAACHPVFSGHVAAIKRDGTLWMWGNNYEYQIGDGTNINRNTPVKILDDVRCVSIDCDRSAAVKKDGSLWIWGRDQSRDDETENMYYCFTTPTKATDGAVSVSLGYAHSGYIDTNGSLWMWGSNYHGQLGDGTTTDHFEPVKVMDGVASVSLGSWHSSAIKNDGSLWTWGYAGLNPGGGLGNGSEVDQLTPIKIMDNVRMAALSDRSGAAVKNDGSLWMWGTSEYPNSDESYSRTPIKIIEEATQSSSSAPARLYGQTALDTMSAITKVGFPNTCETVVIATMGGYWDALAASSLAGLNQCPVLLTNGDSLSSQTISEIKRLGAKNAYIAGGTAAISAKVESQLKGLKLTTTRLAGQDAVGTAVKIYEKGAGSWSTTAIIATAQSYHDALAASPYAYAKKAPVFLTNSSNKLDASVINALKKGGFTNAIICGGTAAVSSSVEGQLKGVGIKAANIKRLSGATAYETAVEISKWCLANGMNAANVGVATGTDYYDALTGASLCGIKGAPLVLVGSGNSSAVGFLKANKASIGNVYVFGGTAAVTAAEYKQIQSALK